MYRWIASFPATLRWLADFFLFGSFFLALCAVGMIYQVYLLFNLNANSALIGFSFCGTLCSYNFHWLLTPASFSGNYKARWSVQHKWLHATLFIAALAGAIFFALQLLPWWRWLLGTALLTFLYSAPMIPHPAARLLQRIAIGKTLFLAFAWTHVTTILPLVMSGAAAGKPELLYVLNRFLLIYAICIVFDYRDRESDRKLGIRSIVTALAPRGVHRFFWAVMSGFLFSTIAIGGTGFSPSEIAALFIPGLLLAGLFRISLRFKGDYFYYFVLDGLMALSMPLLVLF